MPRPRVAIVGAPSSAGAHHAGQEQAPAALRAAGFVDRLRTEGIDVVDLGDVVDATFTLDDAECTARGLSTVVDVARAVADAVAGVVADDRLPVVLGGDCTVTLGVVAGVQRVHRDTGLMYFDGDADLATPETTRSGVLDAMGIAHLLGLTDNRLARLGHRWPTLDPTHLVLFGYDDHDFDAYPQETLASLAPLVRYTYGDVRSAPTACAEAALASLCKASDHLVVHFDVDAIDSRQLPLGNFPHYGTGVSLSTARDALTTFYGASQVAAAVLTEVNPSYDPSGVSVARYVDMVTAALIAGLGHAAAPRL
jgi:arginase